MSKIDFTEANGCVGVKALRFIPMTKTEFEEVTGRPQVSDEEDGYAVEYTTDGYQSWSPKSTFDKHYYQLSDKTFATLTIDDIAGFISSMSVKKPTKEDMRSAEVRGMTRAGVLIPGFSDELETFAENLPIAGQQVQELVGLFLSAIINWGVDGLIPVIVPVDSEFDPITLDVAADDLPEEVVEALFDDYEEGEDCEKKDCEVIDFPGDGYGYDDRYDDNDDE